MKKLLYIAIASTLVGCSSSNNEVRLASPDGKNEIVVNADAGRLAYRVFRNGKALTEFSPIFLDVEGKGRLGEGIGAFKTSFSSRTESAATPVYKKARLSGETKFAELDFGDWSLRLAARDDGVAYRFETRFGGEIVVKDENAPICFDDGKQQVLACGAWSAYNGDCFQNSWEGLYYVYTVDYSPLSSNDSLWYCPMTMLYGDTYMCVTESDLRDYPGWNFLRGEDEKSFRSAFAGYPLKSIRTAGMAGIIGSADDEIGEHGFQERITERADYIAKTAGTRTFPWRVFIPVNEPAKLLESDIVMALAAPQAEDVDFSWVKPGKVAWDWWNDWNITGVDFEAGCNTKTYEYYIDFAAKEGIEYVIFDAGWTDGVEVMKINPAVDVPHLIKYANDRGVGIILWSVIDQFPGREDEVLRHYAEMGAKGFKIDFIDRNDQPMVAELEKVVAAAAKYHLIIDYHGMFKPTGMQRMYPNLVNFEGVNGMEQQKWTDATYFPDHELKMVYARMVAGPMDYTPGAMRNFTAATWKPCNSLPGSQGTRVRQMAMISLFEAPLQMLCDSPSQYLANRECLEFMAKVPTVWSDTKALFGEVGRNIGLARQNGKDEWYVAAIGSWEKQDIVIDTAFLGDGEWKAEIFSDGLNADREATDYRHEFRTIKAGEKLPAVMQPAGGWTARFTRLPETVVLPDTVVIRDGASVSEKYAAEELVRYVKEITGKVLPVVTDAEPIKGGAILLGYTKQTPEVDRAKLGEDGFTLRADGGNLVLAGSDKRGSLYAVYDFLERFAGCGFYSSWCEKVPKAEEIRYPSDLDITEVPALEMREPFWYDVIQHPEFSVKLKANGRNHCVDADPKYGGDSYRFGGGLGSCHTFDTLVPLKEFWETHPEYYSFENGKRVNYPTQLCLTNPDVLKIVIERVLERIRQDPGSKFYGVSQNDCYHNCLCDNCRAIDEEEGSPAGTMVRFVNAVAEAVEKEFPDVLIETLAYQYTRKAPTKTKLRHNVVPCLCTIECEFARSLDKSPFEQNISFRKDIEDWASQTDQLYVWDYVTDFAHYPKPFANILCLQDNIKFFIKSGVKMLFEQGAYQGRHGDFAELKAWLLAKWMWNPDLELEPLLDEFMTGYYGAGAPFVRQYFDELHKIQLDWSASADRPLLIYEGPGNRALSNSFLDHAAELWEKAVIATRYDKTANYNCRMGGFSVDYLRLERLRAQVGRSLWLSKRPFSCTTLARQKELAAKLLALYEEAGDIRLSESAIIHEQTLISWRELLKRPDDASKFYGDWHQGVLEEDLITCQRIGEWGVLVDDPLAENGRALKLTNSHFEWCVMMPMSAIERDKGVKYRLRARIRVDKAGEGKAFWMGIFDPQQRKSLVEYDYATSEVGDDYAWYDVMTWEPGEEDYFWMGPGRFDLAHGGVSAVNGVYIDKLEVTRIEE